MSKREIDVADVEHIGALLTGGLLLVAGYRKGGALGQLLKMGGWSLLFRGQNGYRRLYYLIGVPLGAFPNKVGHRGAAVNSEIVIKRSAQDLYRIFRNFDNLPIFLDHLLSVQELDDTHSQWVARAPMGMVVKWDAEIVRDVENELIAWRSMEGSGVDSAGVVRFEPLGSELTLMKVRLRYDPPAEKAGAALLQIFRCDPKTSIDHDLRRFKAIVELEKRPKQHKKALANAVKIL